LYPGIRDAAAEHNNQGDNQDLQDERSAPADRRRNDPPDQWPCCGSDPACCADDAKRFSAGGQVGKEDRDQNIDGRDQQRRAHAFQQGIAKSQEAQTLGERGDQRSQAVNGEAEHETEFAAPDIRQLAAGDHQGRHGEGKEGDGPLNTAHIRSQVLGYDADGDVHVGGGVTTNELGKRKREKY